ncbi:MAG: DUF3365 domain-containing protein, partial [Alphaproteobacteria bacterium]|nr:DUF3365 domain-containing protein [Alphaproteobacteria bacterium]
MSHRSLQSRFMTWLVAATIGIFVLAAVILGLRERQAAEELAYSTNQHIIATVDASQAYIRHIARPKAREILGDDAFFKEFMSTSYVGRGVADEVLDLFPDFYFKFATLKPHNERNRADAKERELIQLFRDNPDLKEWRGLIERDGVPYLSVATPIRNSPECLECHSTKDAAPAQLIEDYGDSDGFGYDKDEVSIKSVGVPLEVTVAQSVSNAFITFSPMLALNVVLLLTANFLFNRFVTAPIQALRGGANEIRSGQYDHRIAQLNGREFNTLANAFNDMAASIERDIEARKKAEASLSDAKRDADIANKAKSEFLASMSHELRTPLNAVLGYAQMLQYDPSAPLTETQSLYVDSIVAGGNHLLALVSDVLDLAMIEADQIDLDIDEIDAGKVGTAAVAMAAPLGRERGIVIDDRVGGGADMMLRTDPVRMKQVVLNLLTNAVKFNTEGGSVTIEAASVTPGFLRISVTDTGQGIPDEDQARVFHMFHRLGADPMIAREGTGIGLSVTKYLVERMAGRVGFSSKVGQGSTFWIELPLADNDNVLIWTEAMSTHIDPIDKDHQVLVGLWSKTTFHDITPTEATEIIEDLIN